MSDQSKFEKVLKLARRYEQMGLNKEHAIKKARKELKKRTLKG
jgi:hypothetical protein